MNYEGGTYQDVFDNTYAKMKEEMKNVALNVENNRSLVSLPYTCVGGLDARLIADPKPQPAPPPAPPTPPPYEPPPPPLRPLRDRKRFDAKTWARTNITRKFGKFGMLGLTRPVSNLFLLETPSNGTK